MAAILLFLVGLMLSAFFSGSETGLYRVSRMRLVLDGLSGSRTARGIIWLLNHPEIFIATTLVGNNLANSVMVVLVLDVFRVWFRFPLEVPNLTWKVEAFEGRFHERETRRFPAVGVPNVGAPGRARGVTQGLFDDSTLPPSGPRT